MKVVIELPLLHYDRFVERCDQSSRDYEILMNGVIVRRQKEDHFERIIEIHCTVQEAKGLLDLAKQIYPDAVPDIEKALAAPLDTQLPANASTAKVQEKLGKYNQKKAKTKLLNRLKNIRYRQIDNLF